MRDRREVLKLLAGGTAAAAGATLITTSTAFAAGGTSTCQPSIDPTTFTFTSNPTISATTSGTGSSTAIVTIALNAGATISMPFASCETCHPGVTPERRRHYRWTLDTASQFPSGTTAADYVLRNATDSATLSTFTELGTPASTGNITVPNSVLLRRATGGTTFPRSAATFRVRLTVRWGCENLFGGRTRFAWRCQSFLFLITLSSPNGSNVNSSVAAASPFATSPGEGCAGA